MKQTISHTLTHNCASISTRELSALNKHSRPGRGGAFQLRPQITQYITILVHELQI